MYAISTDKAPRTSLPFSEGPSAARFAFVSAQPPVDPATGSLVEEGLGAQANQCLDNVEGVLSELELTFAEVTKLTIYLAGTSDFACVDRVCARRLTKPLPAVTRLEVCSLPGGVPIAIEAIACR